MDYDDGNSVNETKNIISDIYDYRSIAEALVRKRSSKEVRKYPRFPAAEAIENPIYKRYSDSYIVYENYSDNVNISASNDVDCINIIRSKLVLPSTDNTQIDAANLIDFSEDGIQVSFESDNLTFTTRSPVYIEINSKRIPLHLRWNRGIGQSTRCGFHFLRKIDKCPELAALISELSIQLIDRLVKNSCIDIQSNKQKFTFILITILYHLRLQFVRELAELNESIATCEAHGIFNDNIKKIISARKRIYDTSIQARQAKIASGSEEFKNKLLSLLKPYEKYGCSAILDSSNHVLLKREVLLSLMNCIMWKPYNKWSIHMHSSLHCLYEYFHRLFEVFPDEVVENEVGVQFKIYNDLICHITALREQVIDIMAHG
jgi:hypothetical protein